jgi:hypothetical protein
VNDAYNDAMGTEQTIAKLDTTAIVSMGNEIKNANKYDAFFKSLSNRIAGTYFFIRAYEGSDRNILRDEHEYGAFIQKVYYKAPDAVDNPAYNYDAQTGEFRQLSPYDVQATVQVSEKLYGGKGTWSLEIVRPVSQIKEAFLSVEKMAGFVDGIYLSIENKYKVEEERIVAAAANTAMAYAISKGLARNLLAEYNTAHPQNTLTVAQALESAEFLRYACKEIARAKDNIKKMSKVFNGEGYETFTPEENLVLEINTEFEKNCEVYLYSDTFHKELVELPNFESVPYWQTSGTDFAFADTSKISIQHDDLATEQNPDGEYTQTGIVCFLHDTENVAAYFGDRRAWDVFNERSNVVVHGEQAVKGFAVDGHANGIVFYIAA